MTKAGSNNRKRLWTKIVVGLVVGVVAIGLLIFWKRCALAVWYMQGNKKSQEIAILTMLETARPLIEQNLKMTLPQKLLSTMAGKRNEKERQTGALQDVRSFAESAFEDHRLNFRDAHTFGPVPGFDRHGFDFVLEWNGGNAKEVLALFDVNFFKRQVGKMEVNPSCSYFGELKLYVEKRARKN